MTPPEFKLNRAQILMYIMIDRGAYPFVAVPAFASPCFSRDQSFSFNVLLPFTVAFLRPVAPLMVTSFALFANFADLDFQSSCLNSAT